MLDDPAAGTARARTADPYRDLDVIDARAPRFNQAVVGLGALAALATGAWPLLAVLAAQLAVGLVLGRRFCLPCVLYFELVQPRFGEGPLEDARAPRFANAVGAAVLGAASLAYLAGAPRLGAALGVVVACLALVAAATGICAGCELHRLGARLRGGPAAASRPRSCARPAPRRHRAARSGPRPPSSPAPH